MVQGSIFEWYFCDLRWSGLNGELHCNLYLAKMDGGRSGKIDYYDLYTNVEILKSLKEGH